MFESIIKKRLFRRLQHIECGQLTLKLPDGSLHKFGDTKSGVCADIHLRDWRVIAQLLGKGDVGFSEDYSDGYWESSNLENVFRFALDNERLFAVFGHGSFVFKQLSKLLYLTKRNSINGSRKNIQAHYDLGNNFYQLWLDKTMTYSSAIYHDENEDLESAQFNKYNRLLDAIHKPHAKILEIGCGWGGFAELAGLRGHHIKGITLSQEQFKYAHERTKHLNVEIALEDYRYQDGKYDAIVSIEMLEAVGEKYWQTYFEKLAQLINNDGKILIQVIIIDDEYFTNYKRSADMVRTFIFPGGMLPCEAELKKVISANNFQIDDIYYFGKDYAKTLRVWFNQFNRSYTSIKSLGVDDKFIRLWNIYMALCSAGFEHGRINVIHLELSKKINN